MHLNLVAQQRPRLRWARLAPAAEAEAWAAEEFDWRVFSDQPVPAVVEWPCSMLLVARAAPMAIMALPASPARPQVKLSNSPFIECWSRSLCDSRTVGRRRRRVVKWVRAAGSKSLSPPRQFEQPWRPRAPNFNLPLFFYFYVISAETDELLWFDSPYYASNQALAATKIAAFNRRFIICPRVANVAPLPLLTTVGILIAK